jgi:methionyl-tRNA formyltransferase
MSRLFFVVNKLDEFDFSTFLEKHLAECLTDVGTAVPPDPQQYRLIVLWSYRKIVRPIPSAGNLVLFHSSDLPSGRGWAPIYNAVAEGHTHHTISGIFAADEVDSGDVIVKARFPILPQYTAADLRRFDAEISIILIRRILERFRDRPITGKPQTGVPTYRNKRTEDDNGFDISRSFSELINHFRACERDHPAFFDFNGAKYVIHVEPVEPRAFPRDISIEFGSPDAEKPC